MWRACCLTTIALAAGCASTVGAARATSGEAAASMESVAALPKDGDPDKQAASTIHWRLRAQHTRLSMSDRGDFALFLRATNRGPATEHANIHSGEFTVNGVPSIILTTAFGNGGMIRGALDIRPGASMELSRRVGEGLFGAPGDYVIAYTTSTSTSRVVVHVTP